MAETLHWSESGTDFHWRWASREVMTPRDVCVVDDTIKADVAYRLACEGTALVWRGDFQNGRHLLQAMARRLDARAKRKSSASLTLSEVFYRQRQAQANKTRVLDMLLIPVEAEHKIPLRRAPDVAQACTEAYGEANEPYLLSLRELQGIVGAHEWRKKGVFVPALNANIHPCYGVFSPVRGEYVDLVANAPLPEPLPRLAFDIGTGTGVLAVMLAKRGIAKIVATDTAEAAVLCARENVRRLGHAERIDVQTKAFFPSGRADLIVCNPPWLPARAHSLLDKAIYDPENRMLRGFLDGVSEHLTPNGEAWLLLSDLAEHIGLRTRDQFMNWIEAGHMEVQDRLDIRPRHPKAADRSDPLHEARSREVTSLWRLRAKRFNA